MRGKSIFVLMLLILPLLLPQSAQAAPALQTGPYPVTVTISASPSPSYVGQPVTLTVQVTAAGASAGTPAGVVNVTSSQNIICAITLDGAGGGTCTHVFSAPGSVTLAAIYTGAVSYLPGASAERNHLVRARFNSSVEITAHAPSPSVLNQAVSVLASVDSAGPEPTGELTIYRSSSNCNSPPAASAADRCTATMAGGSGGCSLPFTQSGAVTICAAYSGDTATLPSSGQAAHWVSSSNTALGIQRVDPSPSVIDQSAWVYFTLTSPLGTLPGDQVITVTSGAERCSASLSVGRCALIFRQPHLQEVAASYAGASIQQVVFEPATSNVWVQRVNAPPSNILLSNSSIDSFLPRNSSAGDFTTTDPNPDEAHSYTLVQGAGADNNADFIISGSQLVLARSLNNRSGWLSIRVRSTDPAGLFLEKNFRFKIKSGALPATGFAPAKVTHLPAQPLEKAYQAMGEIRVEIPALGGTMQVLGVPWSEGGWDSTWLGKDIGWLEGTAFPSWQGNAVLVGHNTLADGSAGPFARIGELSWADPILVHAYGTTSVYEIRAVEQLLPGDASALRHEQGAWLTLITCQNYDPKLNAYRARVVARAVLVQVRENTDHAD